MCLPTTGWPFAGVSMAPSCDNAIKTDGCDTFIKTDGTSSEIIPGQVEKFSHSFWVGICNHDHTARS
jgi:hypothetical protein